MQKEHKVWLAANYPNQPPEIPAAGCVEEAGELLHALLKRKQLAIWGADVRYSAEQLELDLADAVGDCAIYVCSLCNANNWSYDATYAAAIHEYNGETLALAVDLVAVAALLTKDPKHWRYCVSYMSMLKSIARQCKLDFEAVVANTWAIVKQRRRCV